MIRKPASAVAGGEGGDDNDDRRRAAHSLEEKEGKEGNNISVEVSLYENYAMTKEARQRKPLSLKRLFARAIRTTKLRNQTPALLVISKASL